MKQSVVNDENKSSNVRDHSSRITRSRAKALGLSGGLPPLHPSAKQDNKPVSRANSKRSAASSSNKPAMSSAACPPQKKRAVLKDVTNITCGDLYRSISATKGQPSRQEKKNTTQKQVHVTPPKDPGNGRENIVDENIKVAEKEKLETGSTLSQISNPIESIKANTLSVVCKMIDSSQNVSQISPSSREGSELCMQQESSDDGSVIDIDSKHMDPLMCSLYAADIFSNLYTRQVDRRPLAGYMEKLQRDINQGMRGILVDWLVEVSEEYRLVPDTLYLTVNLIDRFLSENYIEKQKLQLLGVTCMLISAKYEEICAPRVEEFCFITDNTYTKEEVVDMESRVLNYLAFQLSVPTTKKFLRRFIQAAQVSYKAPSVELEFLANYLAELTLIDYNFLKYLPSLIAASAVFLARWTLDQSDHPWNPTLEHYTRYKSPELKNAVFELQDLQLNVNRCMLNAIREKYKQSKFMCVSTLRSAKPVQTLF
ncbi:cyclin-A2-1-like [Andrographis paniculata]|uniref:cyclin-A2-1-like n=1 Tax=Andrographis paniculata TaxID=175694 RepID=UPI0021E7C59B|nr:cyclin-A2-1-like [Andrographis paniculata]